MVAVVAHALMMAMMQKRHLAWVPLAAVLSFECKVKHWHQLAVEGVVED